MIPRLLAGVPRWTVVSFTDVGHKGNQPETGCTNSKEFWPIDKYVGVNGIEEVPEDTGMEKINQGKLRRTRKRFSTINLKYLFQENPPGVILYMQTYHGPSQHIHSLDVLKDSIQ